MQESSKAIPKHHFDTEIQSDRSLLLSYEDEISSLIENLSMCKATPSTTEHVDLFDLPEAGDNSKDFDLTFLTSDLDDHHDHESSQHSLDSESIDSEGSSGKEKSKPKRQ